MSLAFRAESALDALASLAPRLGRRSPHLWIEPFGALVGGDGALQVHGRLHRGRAPREAPSGLVERVETLWRRWETDEVPGATVHARAYGASAQSTTDQEGYFTVRLPLDPDAATAPFTQVELTADGGAACIAQASTPGRTARLVVVSDVDDTALVAHATSRVRQTVNLYLREAAERQPVEGMARLYRALALGASAAPEHNPIAYVSSCPANLVAVVRGALAHQGFPEGPLFLPDVGFDDQKFIKPGHLEHKATCIARVLDAWSGLSAVLFGDTGQADPEVFEHVVAAHPGRVLGVFLRDAPGGDTARADAALTRLRVLGVRAERFDRTRRIEDELAGLGWIRPGATA